MSLDCTSQIVGAASRAELKERSIKSGAVTLGSQVLSQCITVMSVAVLARLLTPEDYGSVAMVTALTGFVNLFRDLGLSGATIQNPNISHDQVSALFFINAGLGALIMLGTMAAAPVIAWFYQKPYLTWVTVGLSFGSLFSSLGTQHGALLNRQMRFRALALIQITALGASFLAALAVAVCGGGYWALVANSVVGPLWTTAGLWIASAFRPGWPRRGTGIRHLLRFGAHIAGFDVAYYFRDNMDKVLIGRVCGAQSLGLYEKAFSLLMLPLASLRYPLNKVAFPAMSRLAGEPELFRSYFAKYCSLLAFASMPLVAILFGCAESVISVLLGSRWMGAAELFKILAVAGFVETVGTLRQTVVFASGYGSRLFRLGLISSMATVLAVVIGLRWGPKGVAVAYCVNTYVMLHPLLLFAFVGTPVRAGDFYRAVAKPCVASIVMLSSYLFLIKPLLHASDIAILCVALPVCMLTYLCVYAALPGGRAALGEFWSYRTVMLLKRKQNNQPK